MWKLFYEIKLDRLSNILICMNGKPTNGVKKNYKKGMLEGFSTTNTCGRLDWKKVEERFPFISFRHSVEIHLTNQNVNPRFIDFLQGHSQKRMGGNVYMKGITIDVLLNECVEKINWDVEWEKLKVKW